MHEPQAPKTITGRLIDGTPATLDVARMTWRPSAYGVCFDDQGRVLLLDNVYNGRREFPGGGVEIWESLSDAVVREVWEETGLHVTIGTMFHTQEAFYLTPGGSHWHVLQHYFFVTIDGGDLRDSIIPGEYAQNPHWADPQTLQPDDLTIGWEALQSALEQHDRG